MVRRSMALSTLLLASACRAAPQTAIPVHKAAPATLKAIKEIQGDVLASACFADRQGEHCVIAWGRNNTPKGDSVVRSELFAAKFTRNGSGFAKKWSIKDFTEAGLTWVDIADTVIRVTDADGDGMAETGFFYEILSDGMDPKELKYMFHAGDRKYAIRGEIPMHMDDLGEYKKVLDPAFKSLSPGLKRFAEGQWDAFVRPTLQALEAEAKE